MIVEKSMLGLPLFRSVKRGASKEKAAGSGDDVADVLAERIAKLNAVRTGVAEPEKDPIETRAAERFVPHRRKTFLTSANGKKIDAMIINVSMFGVAVDADFSKIKIEEVTMVGTHRVEPGRRIMRGTVFLFEKPLAPRSCGPDLVL